MKNYICNSCGAKVEEENVIVRAEGAGWDMFCPICKHGKMIEEQEMKEREELQQQISENNEDEDITPEQDAKEAVEDYLTFAMYQNILELGNDKTYKFIEDMPKADIRARYRKYFLLAGGTIPTGEGITI